MYDAKIVIETGFFCFLIATASGPRSGRGTEADLGPEADLPVPGLPGPEADLGPAELPPVQADLGPPGTE